MKLQREWYIPKNSEEIKATDSTAVAYLLHRNGDSPRDAAYPFQVVTFSGKRAKPDGNYIYRTEEQARRSITTHAESVRQSEEFRAKRKAERYDVRAADHFKVGDLLYTSWGYDQTNIEFWKITRVLEKSVEVVAIGSKSVPGTQGFMSEQVTPDPDNVLQPRTTHDGRTIIPWAMENNGIKRVQRCGDSVSVRIHDHSNGYPIKLGESRYESHYA